MPGRATRGMPGMEGMVGMSGMPGMDAGMMSGNPGMGLPGMSAMGSAAQGSGGGYWFSSIRCSSSRIGRADPCPNLHRHARQLGRRRRTWDHRSLLRRANDCEQHSTGSSQTRSTIKNDARRVAAAPGIGRPRAIERLRKDERRNQNGECPSFVILAFSPVGSCRGVPPRSGHLFRRSNLNANAGASPRRN